MWKRRGEGDGDEGERREERGDRREASGGRGESQVKNEERI